MEGLFKAKENKSFTQKLGDLFKKPLISPITNDPASKSYGQKFKDLFAPQEETVNVSEEVPQDIAPIQKQPKVEKEPAKNWIDRQDAVGSVEAKVDPDVRNAVRPMFDVINKYFGDEDMADAINVTFKESSGNPKTLHPNIKDPELKDLFNKGKISAEEVINKYPSKVDSIDYGLLQINDKAWAKAVEKRFGYSMMDLLEPEKNLEVAKWIFDQQGWQPWVGARSLGLTK